MSSDPLRVEREFTVGPVRVTIWTHPAYIQNGRVSESRRISIDRAPNEGTGHGRREDTLTPSDIPKAILALKKAHDYLEVANRHRPATPTVPAATVQASERVP